MNLITHGVGPVTVLAILLRTGMGEAIELAGRRGTPMNSQSQVSAANIVQRMRRTYTEAKSCQVHGIASATGEIPFAISFVRPDRFRFEFSGGTYSKPSERLVIWRDHHSVHSWWTVTRRIKSYRSLGGAISEFAGVSLGSSLTVSSLLLPREVPPAIDELTALTVSGEETVDGYRCYKVTGTFRNTSAETLWIDKRSYLLRKEYWRIKDSSHDTETTLTYDPKLNVRIENATFQFVPPRRGD